MDECHAIQRELIDERDAALAEVERLKQSCERWMAAGRKSNGLLKAEELISAGLQQKVDQLHEELEHTKFAHQLASAAAVRWHELAMQLKQIINRPPVYGYVPEYVRENLATLEAKHKSERDVENELLKEWARKRKVNAS